MDNTMSKQFIFTKPETGQKEIVERERWRWVAHYNDGTILRQFEDDTGTFHQFWEIDQSKVESFQMVSDKNPEGLNLLIPPQGADLIHFYRKVRLAGTKNWITLYFFGWKIKDGKGKSLQKMICIYPDDRFALVDEIANEGGGQP